MTHIECKCSGRRVPSSGAIDAPFLIVTPAPGKEEIEAGQLFVGRSGKLLWETLARVGVTRDMCRIVPTICTWPEGNDGNPTPAQLAACGPRFDAEMRASRARVALVFAPAVRRVTGITRGIQKIAAYLIAPDECLPHRIRVQQQIGVYKKDGKKGKKGDPKYKMVDGSAMPVLPPELEWIVPSWSPMAIQRSGYKPTWAFVTACDKAARALHGKLNRVHVEIVDARPRAISGGMVAVDIETMGIDSDVIERIGFASEDGSWTALWGSEAKEAAKQILGDPHTIKVAHNIGFDVPRLEAVGVVVRGPLFCTMQGANILEPDLPFGLEPTAPIYLDVQMWKHKSSEEPAIYNLRDAVYEYELAKAEIEQMREEGVYDLFTKRIMPGYRPLMEMTKIGVKLDEPRLAKWSLHLHSELEMQRVKWQGLVGNVEYGSPAQLKGLLYGRLGMRPRFSKFGSVTTDDEALAELKQDYPQHVPVLSALQAIRKTSKLISTYTKAQLGGDGCIHPSFLPKGRFDDEADEARKGLTATLRLTASPNLQNQPPAARFLFIPHDPSMVLLEADYSQIEMRISAALSGDRALAKAIAGDVHIETASIVSSVLGHSVTRDAGKTANYCLGYGGSANKLAKTLRIDVGVDCTPGQAQEIIDRINAKRPDWWRWKMGLLDFVATHRYVTNPFGYRRPLYGGRRDGTKAINTIPQGTAAIMLWDRLPALSALGHEFGGNLLLTVHDSFLFEIPKDMVHEAARAIRDALMVEFPEIAPGFRVPADIKVGTSWGEMKKLVLG